MNVSTLVALLVCLVGMLKIADGAVLMWRITSCPSGPDDLVDAPLFEWAKKRPAALALAVNALFRAPVLVAIQAGGVFLCAGADHTVLIVAAALTVAVAINIVSVLLLATVLERQRATPVYAVSGLHLRRVRPGRRDATTALDPVLTVPLTAASFIVAYAALYFAVSTTDLRAFHVTHPGVDAVWQRLDVFDSLYLSTVTAATVGFGDVYPTSHPAQLLVMTQILGTAAGVTFFVAYLLRHRI